MPVARSLIATSIAAATLAGAARSASAGDLGSLDPSSGNPGFSLMLAGVAVAIYLARRWRG